MGRGSEAAAKELLAHKVRAEMDHAGLTAVLHAAVDVVISGLEDALYAARHAASKDGRPTGRWQAWTKYLDRPARQLFEALQRIDPALAAECLTIALQHHQELDAALAAIPPRPAEAGVPPMDGGA